jgi:hypothetical protein
VPLLLLLVFRVQNRALKNDSCAAPDCAPAANAAAIVTTPMRARRISPLPGRCAFGPMMPLSERGGNVADFLVNFRPAQADEELSS